MKGVTELTAGLIPHLPEVLDGEGKEENLGVKVSGRGREVGKKGRCSKNFLISYSILI